MDEGIRYLYRISYYKGQNENNFCSVIMVNCLCFLIALGNSTKHIFKLSVFHFLNNLLLKFKDIIHYKIIDYAFRPRIIFNKLVEMLRGHQFKTNNNSNFTKHLLFHPQVDELT